MGSILVKYSGPKHPILRTTVGKKRKINTIDLDTIVFIDPETSYGNCDSEEPDNTRVWAEDWLAVEDS